LADSRDHYVPNFINIFFIYVHIIQFYQHFLFLTCIWTHTISFESSGNGLESRNLYKLKDYYYKVTHYLNNEALLR